MATPDNFLLSLCAVFCLFVVASLITGFSSPWQWLAVSCSLVAAVVFAVFAHGILETVAHHAGRLGEIAEDRVRRRGEKTKRKNRLPSIADTIAAAIDATVLATSWNGKHVATYGVKRRAEPGFYMQFETNRDRDLRIGFGEPAGAQDYESHCSVCNLCRRLGPVPQWYATRDKAKLPDRPLGFVRFDRSGKLRKRVCIDGQRMLPRGLLERIRAVTREAYMFDVVIPSDSNLRFSDVVYEPVE